MEPYIPSISHIVCMDRKGVIGYNNSMPWHIPEELQYFKKITANSIVIMGNNTYKSIGKPLAKRVNIVVSLTEEPITEETFFRVNSIEEAFVVAEYIASEESRDIFVIGGSSIYEQTFQLVDTLYVSVIDINLQHHYKHAMHSADFIYYPIPESIDDFEMISEQSLHTTQEVRNVKVLKYNRIKNKVSF